MAHRRNDASRTGLYDDADHPSDGHPFPTSYLPSSLIIYDDEVCLRLKRQGNSFTFSCSQVRWQFRQRMMGCVLHLKLLTSYQRTNLVSYFSGLYLNFFENRARDENIVVQLWEQVEPTDLTKQDQRTGVGNNRQEDCLPARARAS